MGIRFQVLRLWVASRRDPPLRADPRPWAAGEGHTEEDTLHLAGENERRRLQKHYIDTRKIGINFGVIGPVIKESKIKILKGGKKAFEQRGNS